MTMLNENLYTDWLRIAESVVKKRGRIKEHLRFAKRTALGYAFFLDKEIPWEILDEIAIQLSHLYPDMAFARIAEKCSEYANEDMDSFDNSN